MFNNGTAAIIADSGNVIINGNEFQQSGNHIVLNAGVSKAVVVGNIFTGAQTSVDNAQHSQIGLNVADL